MEPALRVSSEEREAAVERLRGHYLAGRLDSGEFEARVHEAHRARDEADLASLFRDLPESRDDPLPPDSRRRRLRFLVLRYALTMVFLIAIWAASGRHGSFWPVWPIIVGGLWTGRQVLAIAHGDEEPRKQLPEP